MSTFRGGNQYNKLLEQFIISMKKIWPECFTEAKCEMRFPDESLTAEALIASGIDADLEALMLASYSIMRFIKDFLIRSKLEYTEQHTYPALSVALENISEMLITTGNHEAYPRYKLADESAAFEQVSRACYHFMKEKSLLGTAPKLTIEWCENCRLAEAVSVDKLCADCIIADDFTDSRFDDANYPLPIKQKNIANDMSNELGIWCEKCLSRGIKKVSMINKQICDSCENGYRSLMSLARNSLADVENKSW